MHRKPSAHLIPRREILHNDAFMDVNFTPSGLIFRLERAVKARVNAISKRQHVHTGLQHRGMVAAVLSQHPTQAVRVT